MTWFILAHTPLFLQAQSHITLLIVTTLHIYAMHLEPAYNSMFIKENQLTVAVLRDKMKLKPHVKPRGRPKNLPSFGPPSLANVKLIQCPRFQLKTNQKSQSFLESFLNQRKGQLELRFFVVKYATNTDPT